MEAGAILLLAAVVLGVLFFILRPFFGLGYHGEQEADFSVAEHQRSALLAERDRLITALAELDFDNRLKKIPTEDYALTRSDLLHETARVLRKLDEMEGLPYPEMGSSPADEPLGEIEIERLLAERRKAQAASSSRLKCLACGAEVTGADKFCGSCGARLGAR